MNAEREKVAASAVIVADVECETECLGFLQPRDGGWSFQPFGCPVEEYPSLASFLRSFWDADDAEGVNASFIETPDDYHSAVVTFGALRAIVGAK